MKWTIKKRFAVIKPIIKDRTISQHQNGLTPNTFSYWKMEPGTDNCRTLWTT